jgi:hypothetical protein
LNVDEQPTAADVNDRRDLRQRVSGVLRELNERFEHLGRQVVDDIPAAIFERIADRRSTSARHPGDNQELLLYWLSAHRVQDSQSWVVS